MNTPITAAEKLKINTKIDEFPNSIDQNKLESYEVTAKDILGNVVQDKLDGITNDIFSSINESYKKDSRIVLILSFILLVILIISLGTYLYYFDSLYVKNESFCGNNEIFFYLFERFSIKLFVVVGLVSLIGYFVKLFTHAYSNNQDIHNILANRIYLENSTLDEQNLDKFKEFTLLKIQNDPLKASKINKSFISHKNLQKIKSLLISEDGK